MVQRLGKFFVHVHPNGLTLYIAELGAIRQVYARKKAFEKSDEACQGMPYLITPSISSCSGAEWQRHRRITAPPFNESNMAIVWHDSLRQTQDMTRWWSSNGEKGTKSSCRDTMILALNVLAAAGFGLTWNFAPAGQIPEGEDEFSAAYRDNLAPLITSIAVMMLTPDWLYNNGPDYPKLLTFVPKVIREHVLMARRFKLLMRRLVGERKALIEKGRFKDNVFLNAIIAKSSQLQVEQKSSSTKTEGSAHGGGLTEDEMFANIVDYNIAGHETTAHTLNYCFHVLAVEPQWQVWIQEELDHIFPASDLPLDPDKLSYEETFYRLKRCLAMMFEMLRVFPPVLMHSKECLAPKGQSHELNLGDRTMLVPHDTVVQLATYSVHLMPEYWGPDAKEWKPARWIQTPSTNDSTSTLAEKLEAETIAPPPIAKETFFPWSMGARDCPGKKFAQVEFVAVMASVLRQHKVEMVPLEGETFSDTRKRIWDYTRDSVPQLTINFREPDKYAIRLVPRA
ncbi:unnamed protein product [Discula destructiva]